MSDLIKREIARRRFLQFLTASPALVSGFFGRAHAADDLSSKLVASADQALNVFDLQAVAKDNLPMAHYGYLASGTFDNETLRANRVAFNRYQLKARRLVNVQKIDTSVELFGKRWHTPIALAPVGGHKAFHEQGEVGVARAAKSRNHLQMLSTMASTPVEEVNAARGEPVWFQLYPTNDWNVTLALVSRAEESGCPVVVVTVDRPAPRKMENFIRARRADPRDCSACHTTPRNRRIGPLAERLEGEPHFRGIDLSDLTTISANALSWDFVSRLKKATSMKVVLKGIVTAEDAKLSMDYGADGIIVSNHGGRSENSLRSTLESLPEVVSVTHGRIPVIMDSGIRRGTDIFKALALGADAVAVGRPYIWGLAAFGQDGVETALDLLVDELRIAMGAHGAVSLNKIDNSFLVDTSRN